MVTSTYQTIGEPLGDAKRLATAPAAKLGAHHLAYLRAVAEGLPQAQAAARYLGHDPRDGGPALRKIHHALVDRVRALARHHGDPRWRLLGLAIKPLAQDRAPPSIDQWASELGLDDFGHTELLALYQQAFPGDRRAARNSRLRAQQLASLQALAGAASETAQPHHRLDAWFPEHLCRSLNACGLLLLSDLQVRVQAGGRWWAAIPRIGAGKADRLRQQLLLLMPGTFKAPASGPLAARGRQLAALITAAPAASRLPASTPGPEPAAAKRAVQARPALPWPGGQAQVADAGAACPDAGGMGHMLAVAAARDLPADVLAVRAWVQAQAGSEATAKSYRREMARFLLFLDQQALTLSHCNAEVCLAYQSLLQDPPAEWTGQGSARRGQAGWSPFSGPLSMRSQQHAVAVVSACFAWLSSAGYLADNPWRRPQRQQGPAQAVDARPDRLLLAGPWAQILGQLEAWSATEPAAQRMLFVLVFVEATGLRAVELLQARLGDLRPEGERWLLQVPGKGGRLRLLPLDGPAQNALARYLVARGLGWDAIAQRAHLPLLASISRPDQGLSYRPLYGSMKAWLNKAVDASDLPGQERMAAARASPHGLRRRCGARALAAGMSADKLGQLLGHASPRSSAKYRSATADPAADGLASVTD